MTGILERKEADKIVIELEDGKFQVVEQEKVDGTASEGDVLQYQEEADFWVVDAEETRKRKEHIAQMTANLWA